MERALAGKHSFKRFFHPLATSRGTSKIRERREVQDALTGKHTFNYLAVNGHANKGALRHLTGKPVTWLLLQLAAAPITKLEERLNEADSFKHRVHIELFGAITLIGREEVLLMGALKKASSSTNHTVSHSALAIEIATALEREGSETFGISLMKVTSLFKELFDDSIAGMIKKWKCDTIDLKFLKKFKVERPPIE